MFDFRNIWSYVIINVESFFCGVRAIIYLSSAIWANICMPKNDIFCDLYIKCIYAAVEIYVQNWFFVFFARKLTRFILKIEFSPT